MEIIDAHLHFCRDAYFDTIARAAQHENSAEHLSEQYQVRGIAHGIVMGNLPLEQLRPPYPPFLSYCVGLGGHSGFDREAVRMQADLVEKHFQNPQCVGLKLYPGYHSFYIYDDFLQPFYELAERYGKPVAVHTGLTASDDAHLKYSHPLVMDEAAVKFRGVQFVLCHFGEPWFADAAAVLEKNTNVAADLSGILEGKLPDFQALLKKKRYYIERLKGWLEYLDCYDRFLFGTDWPLANLGDYIAFTKEIVPREHWAEVFYGNAVRIYHLALDGANTAAGPAAGIRV